MQLSAIDNPFRNSIVINPWENPEIDISSVHQNVYEHCCRAFNQIREGHNTNSMLIYGEAGSGKTHLLARFRAQIAHDASVDPANGLQDAIFVAVRLHTSGRMIWRHVRRCMVNDLLRRSKSGTLQIERLLLHLLLKNRIIDADGKAWLDRRRQELAHNEQSCQELDDLFSLDEYVNHIGYNLRVVLQHVLMGRHRGLAGPWLRGESLPDNALDKLGVSADQNGEDDPEEHARQMIVSLGCLATAQLPFIFCFDQVEALQLDQLDTSGLFAFGQMISTLHAEIPHTLMISSIQSAFLDTLKKSIREADWDRITEYGRFPIHPLKWPEAEQLIKARLDLVPELKEMRSDISDPFWPLNEGEIKVVFDGQDFAARRLISHCADLFDKQRLTQGASPEPPKRSIDDFLTQSIEERRRQAFDNSNPSLTDHIIAHGLPALLPVSSRGLRQVSENIPAGIDLLFEHSSGQIAIGLCNKRPGIGLTTKFESIKRLFGAQPNPRVILLRDSRLPIGKTAKKTVELREELIQQGAQWIEPSIEVLAALDALRSLLSDASSGDLDNHGETVGLKTVQDWLISNLAAELKDLIEQILPASDEVTLIDPATLVLYEEIAAYLQRRHLASVAEISADLKQDGQAIAQCVSQNAERLGVLGDPPLVLFRLVGESMAA